jgi:hypothetical protein
MLFLFQDNIYLFNSTINLEISFLNIIFLIKILKNKNYSKIIRGKK